MRNWVDGPHFPDAAKVDVQSSISDDALENLTNEHIAFLSVLRTTLADCDWNDTAIGECIRATAAEEGVAGRESYVALYWALLGRDYGPKVSAIMSEFDRDSILKLLSV